MNIAKNHFPDTSLLVTHYNRSASLERLLKSFIDAGCSFAAITVSDDCSKPEHLDKLKELAGVYDFQLVTTPKNGGLGNNINKGQDAVETPYTLYVQEDFTADKNFAPHFIDAIAIMNARPELDVARFYAYTKYPYLKDIGKGFSEMIFSPWKSGYTKFYEYSDHPHLRRDTFFERFGRYAEGLNPEQTEYRMMFSFLQNKGKGIFYNEINTLFHQINTSTEPSTMKRSNILRSDNPVIATVRHIYRHIKFNYDYWFLKSRY